jgi:acetyl esterase/lipase
VLDVYVPLGAPAAGPCVVWIHGGGWSGGDKSPAAKAPALLGLGFVVVSVNYRLSGVATHPAQIHDCKAAVRYVRAHAAAFHVDPTRIGVWGSSAGGHLVALVGTSGDKTELEGTVGGNLAFAGPVQAVADYFGPSEFLSITDSVHTACGSPESDMLGVCLRDVIVNQNDPSWADEVSLVRAASPTTHVTSNDPPFYIAYGTADPVVQPQQNVILRDALAGAGVPNTLRTVDGAGHGLPPLEDVATRRFLASHLGVTICPGDWNTNGAVSVQDIFDFLGAYFAGVPSADVNDSGAISVQDVFDMLAAHFTPCG